jgi:tyrosyl-tRNA synthetase
MTLSEELTLRGFIHQTTAPSLAELLDGTPLTIYHGLDPTADSAHVGNFVVWLLLHHLKAAGHRVIFLVGGGTGLIGDPKPDAQRTLATATEIDERVAKLKTQAERLLGGAVTVVNNAEWLCDLRMIDFLRDVGKHFTVSELIKKEAIARRLEGTVGLSYTEFAYPLLQAYDYLTLYRKHGCTLQVGGSDQWGNMVAGVELIRRIEQIEAHVLTVPLVIDATTGKKFGKSEGNAVWLDAEKTSPFAFYQFWFNTSDEQVVSFLKLFTELSLASVEAVAAEHATAPEKRLAQTQLAEAVTALVHGPETAFALTRVSNCLFGEVGLTDLPDEERTLLMRHAPVVVLANHTPLVDVLLATDLAGSKREARTFIESGAVTINGLLVSDINSVLTLSPTDSLIVIRRGKKQVALVTLQ